MSAISVLQWTMVKRSQHDSGDERVTAKSRPMMSLIARAPSHVWSSNSESQVKRSYGHQDPWSIIAEKEERSGRFDIGRDRMKAFDCCYHDQFMESFSSESYSKCDDRAWSSQEWKTDTEMYERSGRPDETSWRVTRNSTWFLSRGNPSWWNRVIRCEWGNASWQTGATRCRFSRKGMASTTRHWQRYNRIGNVSGIKIFRELGEWSGARKTETIFKCYRRWRETFYDWWKCSWQQQWN